MRETPAPTPDAWQKPHEAIHALGLTLNAKVADIGAGTGYFPVRLAHATMGPVYAVDIEPDMVKYPATSGTRELLALVRRVLRYFDPAAFDAKPSILGYAESASGQDGNGRTLTKYLAHRSEGEKLLTCARCWQALRIRDCLKRSIA